MQAYKPPYYLENIVVVIECCVTAVNAACPNGWNRFGDYCYMLSQAPWPYDIARSLCQSNQAELASILSIEENVRKVIKHARKLTNDLKVLNR